jgi:hypothetical protein
MLIGEEERAAHYRIDQLADHITRFCLAAMGLAPPLARSRYREATLTADSNCDR